MAKIGKRQLPTNARPDQAQQGEATKGLETRNNLSSVSVETYPLSIPTPSLIIPNYFVALSMEEDDDDDITVVASNVTQLKKSDDATISTASMSNDKMSDINKVPICLRYYHMYAKSFPTSRPTNKNVLPRTHHHFNYNQQHPWPHEVWHGQNYASKQPTAATAFYKHF